MASRYPSGLDTIRTDIQGNTSERGVHASLHNITADAINKIEAELGINPSGSLVDIATRLDISQNTDGTLKSSAVRASLGGTAYNVKLYGAACDGTTDDTAAFVAAIADMPIQSNDAGSGILYVPGISVVTGITLPTNKRIHLMGAGAGISGLFLKSGSNTDVVTCAGRTGGTDGWWHEVSNLQIDGNKAGNTSGHGVTVLSTRTNIHHCHIHDCAQDAVHSDPISFALSSSGNAYHHLYLVSNGRHGLYLGLQGYDPFLTDLFVYLNGGDGINSATTNVFAKGIHVANNAQNGISLVGTTGGYGMWENIYAHLNSLRGISISGTGETGHRFGNSQLIANGTGGMYISTTNGRTGLFASLVKDNVGPGVEIANCNFNIINGCQFLDFGAPKTQTYGILTTGTADFQTITGNICRAADHLTGGMSLVGTNNTVVVNGDPSNQAASFTERIAANQGLTNKVKAGTVVDGDFAFAPPDGTMAVDSNAAKIWVRYGGSWKSTSTMVGNPVTTKTTTYTASSNDHTIIGDATTAAFQITLPSAAGANGRQFTVKKKDTSVNTVTVGTTSSQTIDGVTTYILRTQWDYVTVESDGSNWIIVAALGGSAPIMPSGVDPTGAADSSTALQAFFTAWGNAGGEAMILPGTYKVTTNLTINNTIGGRLRAAGAMLKVGSTFPLGANPVLSLRGNDYSIEGLRIHGNDIANRCLTIRDNCTNLDLNRIEVSHAGQQATESDLNACGIRFEGNVQNVNIVRPYIHHIVAGTATLAALARGIEFGDPNSVGPAKNVKITDPTITDVTYTGLSLDADGIHIGYTSGTGYATVQIRGGYYTRIFKRAIKIQSPGVSVDGGIFENTYLGTSGVNVTGATDPQVYAAVSVYETDCEVVGFKAIGGSWLNGIEVGTVGTGVASRVKVSDCRVIGGSTAVMTGSGGCRVYGNNTQSDIEIHGNYFGRFTEAVWLSTAGLGINVHGNIGNAFGVANTSGVLIDGDSAVGPTRLNIGVNNFEGTTRYAVEVTTLPAADLNIVGNMGARSGFEVVSPSLYNTPSRRPNAVGNIGSGSTASADGIYGTNMWQGGVHSRLIKFLVVLTYSASITPNATLGDWQTVPVTNATAFTMNAPTNPPASNQTQDLTIEISNTSGGAMGVITWNAIYKLVGGAFTNPATGNKRFITFRWNGTAWVEISRAVADYT